MSLQLQAYLKLRSRVLSLCFAHGIYATRVDLLESSRAFTLYTHTHTCDATLGMRWGGLAM